MSESEIVEGATATATAIVQTPEPVAEQAEAEAEAEAAQQPVAESVEPLAVPVEPVAESVEPLAELGEPMAESVESILESVEPVKEKRKFPWRWVGAVVTMLAVGTGCAFAVMAPQRTELPGLKTAADGRYTFAPLTLPTLAPGQVAPSASGNDGQQHVADIRKLLLAAPRGATPDDSLPGTSGWVSRAATLNLLDNPDASEQLNTDGWRHTAGVAWKTPDGADTKIWLLQFVDADTSSDAYQVVDTFDGGAVGVNAATIDTNAFTSVSYSRVVKGSTATYYGVTQVHDVNFVIVYTAPVSVGLAPFEQEVDLQAELLQ